MVELYIAEQLSVCILLDDFSAGAFEASMKSGREI